MDLIIVYLSKLTHVLEYYRVPVKRTTMRYVFFLCLMTAVFFTFYPIVGRVSGASTYWMRAVVSSTSLAVILTIQAKGSYGPIPTALPLGFLILSGILAGLGAYCFGKVIAVETATGLSVSIPLISTLVIIMNGLFSNLALKEPVSWRMGIGYLFACAAIWLIAGKK